MKISVKVTFKNDCNSSEDYNENEDWCLVGSGTTIQEAIENIFKNSPKEKIQNIFVASTDIKLRKMIESDGERYYSDDEKCIENNMDLTSFGFSCPIPNYRLTYETQCEKFAENLFHDYRIKFNKNEKEDEERKLYLELKKKFENET